MPNHPPEMPREVALIREAAGRGHVGGRDVVLQQRSRVRHPDAKLIRVRRQTITPLEFSQDLKATDAGLVSQSGQIALAAVIGVKALANALGRRRGHVDRSARAGQLFDKLGQQRFDQVDEGRLQLHRRVILPDCSHQRRQPSCEVRRGLRGDRRPSGESRGSPCAPRRSH